VSALYRFLCLLHGSLAEAHVLGGEKEPGMRLRAVRLATDLVEMHEAFGWPGVVEVVRERLGLETRS